MQAPAAGYSVCVISSALPAGSYTATALLKSSDNISVPVNVNLTVEEADIQVVPEMTVTFDQTSDSSVYSTDLGVFSNSDGLNICISVKNSFSPQSLPENP